MRRICCLLFICLIMAFALAGCAGEKTKEIQFMGNYTLIRSDYDNRFPSKTAVAVRKILNDAGSDIGLKTDYVSERTGDFATDNELLIGPTEREESIAALEGLSLGVKDFYVKPVGTRIVLLAGSNEAYFAAAEWLTSRFDAASGILSLPADGYSGTWVPPLEGLMVDGNPISEYTIVCGTGGLVNDGKAGELQQRIFSMTGETVPVVDLSEFDGNGKAIRLCAPAEGVNAYSEVVCAIQNGDIVINALSVGEFEKLLNAFYEKCLSETSEKNITGVLGEIKNAPETIIKVSGSTPTERGAQLSEAFKKADKLLSDDSAGRPDVIIELSDGMYQVNETLKIKNREMSKLTIRAAEGANPVISGGVPIPDDSFTKVEGTDYYMARIDSGVKFRDIYAGGRRIPLASSDYYIMKESFDNVHDLTDPVNKNGLYLSYDLVSGLESCAYPTEYTVYVEWEFFRLHITGVDMNDTKTVDGEKLVRVKFDEKELMAMSEKFHSLLGLKNQRYYLANNVSFLKPGTCVADYAEGVLYYYPESGAPTGVSYSMTEKLMDFYSVAHLTIEGISFTGTSCNLTAEEGYQSAQANTGKRYGTLECSAVSLKNCSSVRIDGCRFIGLGTNGVKSTDRVSGLSIENCVFDDVAMSAISIGNHNTLWDSDNANYDIVINNNTITNTGYEYPTATAVYISHVDDLKLTHNTVDHCAYSGFSVGWGWSTVDYEYGAYINIRNADISYNRITNFMERLRDGAAIYVLGANCTEEYRELFNEMHHNYAENPGWEVGDGFIIGYYLDGSSSNWYVHDSIVSGVHRSVFAQYSVPGQYNHNVKIEHIWSTKKTPEDNEAKARNVILGECYTEKTLEALYEKYPEAKKIAEEAGAK